LLTRNPININLGFSELTQTTFDKGNHYQYISNSLFNTDYNYFNVNSEKIHYKKYTNYILKDKKQILIDNLIKHSIYLQNMDNELNTTDLKTKKEIVYLYTKTIENIGMIEYLIFSPELNKKGVLHLHYFIAIKSIIGYNDKLEGNILE
jgi:hypothetical protein